MGSSTQCAGSITYNNQNENITLAKQSRSTFGVGKQNQSGHYMYKTINGLWKNLAMT